MIRRLRRRILRRTEDRLVKYGWQQGRMGNPEVGYCLVGAVSRETRWPHLFVLRPAVYRDLINCVEIALPSEHVCLRSSDLTYWNDRADRTEDEVLAALRCARGEETPR